MTVERTLHHFPLDPASRQVRLVLGEKRLPFVDVSVRYWERPRELTKMNPSGMVPVLVETGTTVVAVDAGRTLMLDKERMLGAADQAGVAIVGF